MLSQNLKKYREKKGLSQKKLGELINISQQGYAKYEIGTATPDPERLSKIAEILEISIDQLIAYNEKKPVHVDEPEQGKISPEKKILISAYDRASDDDRRVLWTLLDKYMTPNEKQYFSQSEQENNVG